MQTKIFLTLFLLFFELLAGERKLRVGYYDIVQFASLCSTDIKKWTEHNESTEGYRDFASAADFQHKINTLNARMDSLIIVGRFQDTSALKDTLNLVWKSYNELTDNKLNSETLISNFVHDNQTQIVKASHAYRIAAKDLSLDIICIKQTGQIQYMDDKLSQEDVQNRKRKEIDITVKFAEIWNRVMVEQK